MGAVAPRTWISTDWLLNQFAKTRPVAQRRYAQFVAQGKNLPAPWPELKGQVLLGSDAFVNKMRPRLAGKAEFKEIPRAQRWAHRPGLKSLFSARVRQDKRSRDAAMRRACLEYGYTMAAVARGGCTLLDGKQGHQEGKMNAVMPKPGHFF